METETINELIQLMRTLTISQLRKQLEQDNREQSDRLAHVYRFIKAAKEQPK